MNHKEEIAQNKRMGKELEKMTKNRIAFMKKEIKRYGKISKSLKKTIKGRLNKIDKFYANKNAAHIWNSLCLTKKQTIEFINGIKVTITYNLLYPRKKKVVTTNSLITERGVFPTAAENEEFKQNQKDWHGCGPGGMT